MFAGKWEARQEAHLKAQAQEVVVEEDVPVDSLGPPGWGAPASQHVRFTACASREEEPTPIVWFPPPRKTAPRWVGGISPSG